MTLEKSKKTRHRAFYRTVSGWQGKKREEKTTLDFKT